MSRTRAQENRAIRQEALREQLSKQKHVEKVIDLVKKLEEPDSQVEGAQLQRVKLAIETRLVLIKKYLPDLKQTEVTGEGGGPVELENLADGQIDSQIDQFLTNMGYDPAQRKR